MDLKFFNNKVVCITGSSRGIGKAVAILLGKNGAKICLNGRNERVLKNTYKELQALNIDCICLKADVSKDNEAHRLINGIIEQYGNLDVLINNAGISSRGLIADTHTQAWKNIIDINLLGTVFPTIYSLPHIIKARGSIILISSIGAKIGLPGQANYSVSKMGLTAFAQALQIEHKSDDIHIGIVYLGFVENEVEKKVMLANGEYESIKPWKKTRPTSREDVAHAIAKTIIKRRNSVTLTVLGKLENFSLKFLPWTINYYLRKDLQDFKKFFT